MRENKKNKSSIGGGAKIKNSTIAKNAVIINSSVAKGAEIIDSSVADNAHIEKSSIADRAIIKDTESSFKPIFKRKLSILIIVISILIFSVTYLMIDKWSDIKIIITAVSGLGGLWGFITLILNLLKLSIRK